MLVITNRNLRNKIQQGLQELQFKKKYTRSQELEKSRLEDAENWRSLKVEKLGSEELEKSWSEQVLYSSNLNFKTFKHWSKSTSKVVILKSGL